VRSQNRMRMKRMRLLIISKRISFIILRVGNGIGSNHVEKMLILMMIS
jgi:hypothetical protein